MKISSLKLKNFRNYEMLDLDLHDVTNIFYGDNAQGKTNILEAVYLCGTTKSHRGTKDKDMIRFGEDESHLNMIVEKQGTTCQIDMHLKKNKSKGIAVNRVPLRKASELFGILNVVFFSPEDLNIIKEGPAQRRRFIDAELSQIDKIYLNHLSNYNKIVSQRNHLLKEIGFRPDLKETLDVWDLQLSMYGTKVIEAREQFVSQLNEIIIGIHSRLTGGREKIELVYEPDTKGRPLEEILRKNRDRDLRMMSTSCGPHRDDLCILVNDIDIRKFGSQGQQRTAALSLKLSEIELVKKITGDKPVLLLDDVLSELDQNRQNYLLDSIDDIQTLITCTGVEEFVRHRFEINKVFHVREGQVIKEN